MLNIISKIMLNKIHFFIKIKQNMVPNNVILAIFNPEKNRTTD